jgi:hypothetical protein
MIRVLIAGEGPNEIGTHFDRSQDPRPILDETVIGVIEALLLKIRPGGWKTHGTMQWKAVPKLRPNSPGEGERGRFVGWLCALVSSAAMH